MMFSSKPCAVCAEKDLRISDLKSSFEAHKAALEEQIEYFKNVLNPPARRSEYIPPVDLQEDMLLDGGGKEETELPEDSADTPEVLAERSAMLSGTY